MERVAIQDATSRTERPDTAAAKISRCNVWEAARLKNAELPELVAPPPSTSRMKCDARRSALSMSATAARGFHHQVFGTNAMRWGSSTQTSPTPARSAAVSIHRSGLLEVATTAPGAERMPGTAIAEVLFERGPMNTTATSSHDL